MTATESARSLGVLAMQVVEMDALTLLTVEVVEAVAAQNMVVGETVVDLEPEEELAALSEQALAADQCGCVLVVHAQVVEHRDGLFAEDGRLDSLVAAVHVVFAEPIINVSH